VEAKRALYHSAQAQIAEDALARPEIAGLSIAGSSEPEGIKMQEPLALVNGKETTAAG
jgi:hypothetical protein